MKHKHLVYHFIVKLLFENEVILVIIFAFECANHLTIIKKILNCFSVMIIYELFISIIVQF